MGKCVLEGADSLLYFVIAVKIRWNELLFDIVIFEESLSPSKHSLYRMCSCETRPHVFRRL